MYSESKVVAKRLSNLRRVVSLMTLNTVGYNQAGDIVITFSRTLLVYRSGHGLSKNRPRLKIQQSR